MPTRTLSSILSELERDFFFRRTTGRASPEGYIASNTWRGWTSTNGIDGAVRDALYAAFDQIKRHFDDFYAAHPSFTRDEYDTFHSTEVESLHNFLNRFHRHSKVFPRANGDFNNHAYNAYAKIVNLGHTHWCFRDRPGLSTCKYDPQKHPILRKSLHVPLDLKVLKGIRVLINEGLLHKSDIDVPSGAMGAVKSLSGYLQIQRDI